MGSHCTLSSLGVFLSVYLFIFVLGLSAVPSMSDPTTTDTISVEERRRQRLEERLRQRALEDEQNKEPTPILALPGPAFPSFDLSPPSSSSASPPPSSLEQTPPPLRFTVAGTPVFVIEGGDLDGDNSHTSQTASSVWDCSFVLAKALERHIEERDATFLKGKTVVELGSGTGLLGVSVAALCGADSDSHVVLTDVPADTPNLEASIRANEEASLGYPLSLSTAHSLDWTDRSAASSLLLSLNVSQVDLVIAADVIWVESLVQPFVYSISELLSPGSSVMWLAHKTYVFFFFFFFFFFSSSSL